MEFLAVHAYVASLGWCKNKFRMAHSEAYEHNGIYTDTLYLTCFSSDPMMQYHLVHLKSSAIWYHSIRTNEEW